MPGSRGSAFALLGAVVALFLAFGLPNLPMIYWLWLRLNCVRAPAPVWIQVPIDMIVAFVFTLKTCFGDDVGREDFKCHSFADAYVINFIIMLLSTAFLWGLGILICQ